MNRRKNVRLGKAALSTRWSSTAPHWARRADLFASALNDVVCAIGAEGLDFNEKREILTIAAELHGIDPSKLQARGPIR